MSLLLEHEVMLDDVNNALDTPLHCAVKQGRCDVVSLLVIFFVVINKGNSAVINSMKGLLSHWTEYPYIVMILLKLKFQLILA